MCRTGKRLIRKWSTSMKLANMDNWQSIMFGIREYDVHKAKCKICNGKDKYARAN